MNIENPLNGLNGSGYQNLVLRSLALHIINGIAAAIILHLF